jgi:hypothetical protein
MHQFDFLLRNATYPDVPSPDPHLRHMTKNEIVTTVLTVLLNLCDTLILPIIR